jgi:hypothetical protein
MYITASDLYMGDIIRTKVISMTPARHRAHKHFQLDSVKIKRAQKALRAKTETETIDRALDLVISEAQNNRLTLAANERFLRSGIEIKDVYGVLDE